MEELQKNIISKENIDFENEQYYFNLKPKCEPQLGKYNIYEEIGGTYNSEKKEIKFAILWVLNFSDGKHSLQHIARRSKINLDIIQNAANILIEKQLISKIENNLKK